MLLPENQRLEGQVTIIPFLHQDQNVLDTTAALVCHRHIKIALE